LPVEIPEGLLQAEEENPVAAFGGKTSGVSISRSPSNRPMQPPLARLPFMISIGARFGD
jgi:hypothetical protein